MQIVKKCFQIKPVRSLKKVRDIYDFSEDSRFNNTPEKYCHALTTQYYPNVNYNSDESALQSLDHVLKDPAEQNLQKISEYSSGQDLQAKIKVFAGQNSRIDFNADFGDTVEVPFDTESNYVKTKSGTELYSKQHENITRRIPEKQILPISEYLKVS